MKVWNRKNRKRRQRQSCADLIFREPAFDAPTPYQSRYRADGKPGTRPQAVILDMDGTLENWDGHPNPPAMDYATEHHAAGRVLIIVTARDHEWSYQRTHDWLRKHLHLPFVGPICRPADDERYACDFKRHVYDQLSVVYDIVSAIDDDKYVLDMWRSIEGLDVVSTGYNYSYSQGKWRGAVTSWPEGDRWSTYEPTDHEDDEYEWIRWEEDRWIEEVQRNKRRQPKTELDWEREIEELDLCCDDCDHPWFEHTIEGCQGSKHCNCNG